MKKKLQVSFYFIRNTDKSYKTRLKKVVKGEKKRFPDTTQAVNVRIPKRKIPI